MVEFDPVEYGALMERVQNNDRRFDEMRAKIDKMETSLDRIVALANLGKGGFWAGMALVSLVSSAVGFVISWFKNQS